MATTDQASAGTGAATQSWYALVADDVAKQLGVDPPRGSPRRRPPSCCRRTGPTRCPPRSRSPGWRRFLDQYRSYMQIILLVAGVVSLVIGQWSTGAVLILLTVFNAVVGLRQEGKAESAMNALKSMMKATARVRRDGAEAEIPAEQVVVGDVVLLSAGDDVAADGRIIEASSLDIDESALTGRERAGVQGGGHARRRRARPRRPDEHGVHEHAGHARQRHDDRDRDGRRRPGRQDRRHAGGDRRGTDAADQAAQHDDPVDRRGRAGHDDRHVRARPLARRVGRDACSSPRSPWRSPPSRRRCRPSSR